jgi:hypothetical protein
MQKVLFYIRKMEVTVYCGLLCLVNKYSNLFLFVLGMIMLTYGIDNIVLAAEGTDESGSGTTGDIIKEQYCNILSLLQGHFGALVMVVAGLAAVVTAAMGAYKMAMSCVVIRPFHNLFKNRKGEEVAQRIMVTVHRYFYFSVS